MTKAFLGSLRDEPLLKVIASGGFMIGLNVAGQFKWQRPFDLSRFSVITEVDMVSLLQYGTQFSLAVIHGGNFYTKDIEKGHLLMGDLGRITHMRAATLRKGEIEGIPYNQYIYAFNTGQIPKNILNLL